MTGEAQAQAGNDFVPLLMPVVRRLRASGYHIHIVVKAPRWVVVTEDFVEDGEFSLKSYKIDFEKVSTRDKSLYKHETHNFSIKHKRANNKKKPRSKQPPLRVTLRKILRELKPEIHYVHGVCARLPSGCSSCRYPISRQLYDHTGRTQWKPALSALELVYGSILVP